MAKLQVAIWNKGSVQTFDIPDDIPNKEAEAKKHVDAYIEKLLKDIKVEWFVDYKQNQYRSCSKSFKIEDLDEAMLFLNNVDENFEEYKEAPNFKPNKKDD
jgi:bifunctional ADP-heptose synthase (sugar kinase/adenylyltransferase)